MIMFVNFYCYFYIGFLIFINCFLRKKEILFNKNNIFNRHYAGYKQGDPGYGAKSLAELENQRNSDQQGNHGQSGQLYSPSPARKGDSSLSGQKGSDTSGILFHHIY